VRRPFAFPFAAAAGLAALAACSEAPLPLQPEVAGASAARAPAKPDLTIQLVSHTPAHPSLGDTITVTATVANVGGASAKRFGVMFDFGGAGSPQVVSVPGLAAGATLQISTTFEPTAAGTWGAIVTADNGDMIKEPDETNNTRTDIFGVAGRGFFDFETDTAGNPICATGCDLTAEYWSRGVQFLFAPTGDANGNPSTTKTNASICDGSLIDPPELVAAGNHVVSGAMAGYPCGGSYAGFLRMMFAGEPTTVQFLLRARDGCPLPIGVAVPGGSTPNVLYTTTRTYPANGGAYVAVERLVTVTSATGILEITVDQAACNQYVDDLHINMPI
jgi:hypothetical protein